MSHVAGQVCQADHLTLVIDTECLADCASEAAEVTHHSVLPENGVERHYAITRAADSLTVVVDRDSLAVRVAGKRRKFLHAALLRKKRLKVEKLRRCAGWVCRGILCVPNHLASIVDAQADTVIAS